MLADIVGSAREVGANHYKFFRYRDDVVGRRFGIVCIRRSAQTALKCFGDPGYAGAEFKVDRLLEHFGVIDDLDEAQGRDYVRESQFRLLHRNGFCGL
jgi:hypothetical protein